MLNSKLSRTSFQTRFCKKVKFRFPKYLRTTSTLLRVSARVGKDYHIEYWHCFCSESILNISFLKKKRTSSPTRPAPIFSRFNIRDSISRLDDPTKPLRHPITYCLQDALFFGYLTEGYNYRVCVTSHAIASGPFRM